MLLVAWLFAEVATASAIPTVADGVRAYEAAELERARALLERALLDTSLDAASRIRAHAYLAATHLALGDQPAARTQLAAMLDVDANARLDAAVFAPELLALLDRVKRDRAAAEPKRPEPPAEVKPSRPSPPMPQAPQPPPAVVSTAEPGPRRTVGAVLLASGVVVAATGTYGLVTVRGRADEYLRQQGKPPEQRTLTREAAQRDLWLYPACGAAVLLGAAAGVYGAYELFRADVAVAPTGTGVAVQGSF